MILNQCLRAIRRFLSDLKASLRKFKYLQYYWLEFPYYKISLKQIVPAYGQVVKDYTKRKVTIITAYNREYKVLGDMSASQIKKYCARYDFGNVIFEAESLSPRPYPWLTPAALYYTLTSLLKRDPETWVFWIDADAFIVNLDFNVLTQIIQKAPPEKEIFMAKDFNGINAGVIILKNTSFVKRMLEKAWSLRKYINDKWWWQRALIDLIDRNWKGIQDKIQYVPQHILNAYTHELYGENYPQGELTRDSFIYHIPGQPLNLRIEQAKKILSE